MLKTTLYLTLTVSLLFIVEIFLFLLFLPVWIFIALMRRISPRSESPKLVWGHIAIISYKYWSNALKKAGYDSTTLVDEYTKLINKKEDYDLETHELFPWLKTDLRSSFLQRLINLILKFLGFTHTLSKYDIFHHAFFGGYLGQTRFWRVEAYLLKLARCKTVIMPIGADAYIYSDVSDFSLRHVLLISLPNFAKEENKIKAKVSYWLNHADIVMTSLMLDSMSRWDLLPYSSITIDCTLWQSIKKYSHHNGLNGTVKVIHTPNFRGFKGTEFVIKAIEELQEEGLQVELILIEKKPNEEVRRLIQEEADILAEQFIFTGYALSGIEGMSSGLPVLSNLDNEHYTRVFRRYSYLNECPILSTTPETIKDNLRILITNPQLREELGKAGREYVEKYHSEETAQYIFTSIYDKIWHNKDVNLMNLFHPLKSQYNLSKPFIKHPLIENHLP